MTHNSFNPIFSLMLLGCPFGVFVLGRPNELLHERHNSVLCVIECNESLYIFVEMWPVSAL